MLTYCQFYKYNAHTEPLLKTPNLFKIEDIMKTKALKLYYRYKQNELPKYFESMFTESNDNHSHDTRHKSLLYQLPTKTGTGRLCIRHYIPELLSKTPECINEKLVTHSFSGFSNYMKNYYIRNYNENCLIENSSLIRSTQCPPPFSFFFSSLLSLFINALIIISIVIVFIILCS